MFSHIPEEIFCPQVSGNIHDALRVLKVKLDGPKNNAHFFDLELSLVDPENPVTQISKTPSDEEFPWCGEDTDADVVSTTYDQEQISKQFPVEEVLMERNASESFRDGHEIEGGEESHNREDVAPKEGATECAEEPTEESVVNGLESHKDEQVEPNRDGAKEQEEVEGRDSPTEDPDKDKKENDKLPTEDPDKDKKENDKLLTEYKNLAFPDRPRSMIKSELLVKDVKKFIDDMKKQTAPEDLDVRIIPSNMACRLDLPIDLTRLKGECPLSYLKKYCRVTDSRRTVYKEKFDFYSLEQPITVSDLRPIYECVFREPSLHDETMHLRRLLDLDLSMELDSETFTAISCLMERIILKSRRKMTSEPKLMDNKSENYSNYPCKMKENSAQGKLNYGGEQIKTFTSCPVHFPVHPSCSAKANFYYRGTENEMIRFSCEGHPKKWSYGDIVLKKHADLYSNCDFIKNGSNNVPLIKTESKSRGSFSSHKKTVSLNGNCLATDLVDFTKMKTESERLKSFSRKWPVTSINISDLAKAGFFYTGTGDKVQCPYCEGKISNWEPGDVPFQEHLKHFPWCDFVTHYVTQVKEGSLWYQPSYHDVCGNWKKPENNSHVRNKCNSLENLAVHLQKSPIHPDKAVLCTRLLSFDTWPSDAPVSKEDLSAAGFFYIGINDRTTCFHCDGSLCSWVKGDDPWVEHARWFSNCDFLRLNKGVDFIKSCAAKNSASDLKEDIPLSSPKIGSVETLLNKVDKAMQADLVKQVLECNLFPDYIVRAAILFQIKQNGTSFLKCDDLCVASSYLKEEMEKESLDTKHVEPEDINICENITNSCIISNAPQLSDELSVPSRSSECPENQESYLNKCSSLEDNDSRDHRLCKICMENEAGIAFLPCGHLHACTVCASVLKYCPMCRKPIQAIIRVYLD